MGGPRWLTQAAQAYHGVSAAAEEEFPEDTDAERAVELAHLEVVRAQHQVDQRVRPGAIAAAALVAASILAAVNGLWFLTVASLAGAAALIRWLVIDPRRVLAAAGALEAAALDRRGVTSWLGMHLRRLDDAANATERTRFEKVANNWVIGLPPEFLAQYVPMIQKVTPEQIMAMGKKYFDPKNQSIVVVGDPSQVSEQLVPYGEFSVEE